MGHKPLPPGKELEKTLQIVDHVMKYTNTKYWLCFGGLWGLVQNGGVIPDADLDLCTYYGTDFSMIAKVFSQSPGRYVMTRAMVDDRDQSKALYCSFSSEAGLPHLCLSFWYLHNGIRYYCHDQMRECEGIAVPKSGYFFRGIPAGYVDDLPENFRMSEWYGIPQMIKIRVPRLHVGSMLDIMYPDWAYKKQRYEVIRNAVHDDKMASYHRGGALSPYAVHVKSMGDFQNQAEIERQLAESKKAYDKRIRDAH